MLKRNTCSSSLRHPHFLMETAPTLWLTTSLPWWLGSCRAGSACPQHHQESDCKDIRAAAAVMEVAGVHSEKSTV
jgi:hypothetical protein